MTFRVISLSLTFTAIVSAWLSEPPCLLVYDVQSHLSQLDIPSYQFSFGIQSRCFSLEFRVIVLVQHSQLSYISFRLEFKATFSFRHSESLLHFGVQNHCFILVFRAIVCSQFSICSHHACFFLLLFWRSESRLHFDVQSCVFILAFRATFAFLVRRSEPHCHLGVQSRILTVWCSEPSFVFSLGIQSLCSSLVWRSGPYFHFGVQSHCLFLVWHFEPSCISFVQRSEPYLQFGIQSHTFNLMFRVYVFYLVFKATFSVRHSNLMSIFSFNIQIHHYFPPFFAFSAIGHTPSGLWVTFSSSILAFRAVFHTHSCILSHHLSQFRHSEPSSLLSLAFRAIITSQFRRNVFRTGPVIEPKKLPVHGSLVRPVVEPLSNR